MDHPIDRRAATRIIIGTVIAVALAATAVGWTLTAGGGGLREVAGNDATAGPTAGGPGTASPEPSRSPSSDPDPDPDDPPDPPTGRTEPSPSPTPTAEPGPRIVSFRVTQQPRCPGGTDVNPIPGQPVVLAWQVTGAAEVTLSVDGPGVFDSYPADGGDTLNFPCSATPGDRQEHTYLLTATANGKTATETLVVTARVQDRPDV